MTLSHLLFLSAYLLLWFASKSVLCSLQDLDDTSPIVNNYVNAGYSAINVVQLTQRGYLQFLKYVVDVPPLHEFTFCIWVKSVNFTYSQPIFSYSKDERERLVRAWISPHGTHINLAVQEVPIFSFPMHLQTHHWNHICQSWSSYQGAWALYINTKLMIHGFEPKSSGLALEGGGDIVIGQEYTDFDKGYEDGIEGAVYGFNLVHAFTSVTTLPHPEFPNSIIHFARKRHIIHPAAPVTHEHQIQRSSRRRQKRGILDMFRNMLMFFVPPPPPPPPPLRPKQRLKTIAELNVENEQRIVVPTANSRILSTVSNEIVTKPFGLKLVELGYDCLLGKGAPLHGEKVLVSWTKTTVRVFGGAILKPEIPFCIK